MNLKFLIPHVVLVFSSLFIIEGCSSTSKIEEYIPVDYSEEASINREINEINGILEKDTVKALWRTVLMTQNGVKSESCTELMNQCIEKSIQEYNKAVDSKDYYEALRIYSSIKACGLPCIKDLSRTDKELNELIEKNVTAYSSVSPKNDRMSSFIKGTVTVFVDKGIKVSYGRGMNDMTLGSGFFISKDGYIITNHHVIEDCVDPGYEGYLRLYVKLAEDSDTRIPAKVIGYDSSLDLALLKVEIEAPYVFSLGSSLDLDVGDKVYAIGSPLGLDRTLTSGIISAKDRDLLMLGKVFQIDAAVNSGNSGGPLIDEQGRVQAIVFAGMLDYEGLNFAIPVEYLKTILPQLYAGGKREQPWLGCYGKTKKLAGSGTRNEGLTVNYLMPGGSSCVAGIEKGEVIKAINAQSVTSIDDMQMCLMQVKSGTVVDVEAEDLSGNRKHYLVYAEKRPDNPGYEIYRRDILSHSLYPLLGMDMAPVSQNRKSYMITEVLKGSSADEAGFSSGDPVEVLGIDFNDDKSYAYIRLSVKKKKSAYLDYTLGLQISSDSPYYF